MFVYCRVLPVVYFLTEHLLEGRMYMSFVSCSDALRSDYGIYVEY